MLKSMTVLLKLVYGVVLTKTNKTVPVYRSRYLEHLSRNPKV